MKTDEGQSVLTSKVDGSPRAAALRVAYLTGRYPEVSLTFILREVEALRRSGLEVLTCSIRRTPPEQHLGLAEKEAAQTTFHVLESARNPLSLLAAQSYLLRSPIRYLGALRLAWATRSPGWKAAVYQLIFFVEATILARHLERNGVEHIHNHFVFGSATVAMLASKLTGIPYSFTLHGPADLFEPYRWALKEKTARAAFVVAISHFARSQLMFFSDPDDWHKLHVVHCGVDADRYDEDRPARKDAAFRLLFVGRLARVKGLRVLFDALRSLASDFPNLRLHLVGDGPDRAELEAVADAHVTFAGYKSQAEVAALMKEADLFVLPSFAEGVPVVLMEAMASRLPVIATRVAGVAELVEENVSGLLVPPGDTDALAQAIRTLVTDRERSTAMGEAGQAKVAADFDIDTEAAKLAALFRGQAGTVSYSPSLGQDLA